MKYDTLDLYLLNFDKKCKETIEQVVLWLQEEFKKTGAKGAVLGMSGGLDCSVVCRLLQLAEIEIHLVMMPNGRSMQNSNGKKDAMKLIQKFSLEHNYSEIDITKLVEEKTKYVTSIYNEQTDGLRMAIENIPSIERMSILSALGQAKSFVLVGTGNLSEREVGYFTKRGDGLSDLNPLANFTKSEVRILAKHLGIHQELIDKKPSADLKEGQTDEEDIGLTIEEIDGYIRLNIYKTDEVKHKMDRLRKRANHKLIPIPLFTFKPE